MSFVGGWFVYVPVPICPEEFTQLLTSFPGGVQAPLQGPRLGHVLVENVISTGPDIRHFRTGMSSAVLGMALRCWLLARARGATLEKSRNYGESRSTLRTPSRDQGWS